MKKEETWQEVQKIMNYFHGPVRAAAIGAQNWAGTSWLLLTSIAGLKSVAKDSSIEKRHQLIRSGIADILHSVVGGWMIWQAYNLNETGGSTTPIPTTTEADLPTFPPFSSNDAQLFAIAEQLTDAAINNELTPEMISVALNKALISVNGVIKVVSGLSGFDLYKVQQVTKVIEYLKSLSSFATAGLNVAHSNAEGASLMAVSGIMDLSHTYLSATNKFNDNDFDSNNANTKDQIIITMTTGRKKQVVTFPLHKGKLYYQDATEVCHYLENNDWDVFKIEQSDQTVDGFIKRGKMKHVEPTLNKFKEWIDNYIPDNKKVKVVVAGEGNDVAGERLKKLQVPMYEFEPEFVNGSNNHDIPEVIIGSTENSPLIQF